MSLRASVLKGAGVLSAGQALGQALSLVRNIIVARLISPDDFGIAATFALTVSLLEMLSDLGAEKLLIQARDGDEEALQATAQLWQFTRGLTSAVLIAAAAWPMSRLFKVPQAQWAFYWLALVPLLRGLVHLDIKRLQRGMRFRPQVLTEVGPQALITAAAAPLAWWLRDYSAVLWLVIVQAAALALLSHVQAERPYRWGYSHDHARRLLSFGWPLLINGLLMFGIFQGDRAVVGATYLTRDLGLYAAAMALAMAPSHVLGSIVASVALPLLAHAQTDSGEFERRYSLCAGVLALPAGALAVFFVLVGPGLLRLTFGESFSPAAVCLMFLGGAQAMRLLRVGTTCGAMALGDTANSMWANAWRVTGLGAALAVAALNAPLHWIAAAGLFGEVLAVVYSILRLRRRHGIRPGTCLRPALATLPAVVAAVLVCGFGFPLGVVGTGLLTMGLLALCFVLVLLTTPDLRRELGRLLPYRTAPVTIPD